MPLPFTNGVDQLITNYLRSSVQTFFTGRSTSTPQTTELKHINIHRSTSLQQVSPSVSTGTHEDNPQNAQSTPGSGRHPLGVITHVWSNP